MSAITQKQKEIIDIWKSLPQSHPELSLENDLVTPLLKNLEVDITVKFLPSYSLLQGGSCTPDRLIFTDPNQPPVLVMENKKRVNTLAKCSDEDFESKVTEHSLYNEAVNGSTTAVGGLNSRGIKQYLDIGCVPQKFLPTFGLVFNGDFFQLWRRIDGLVLPLSPILRFNSQSIPALMRLLEQTITTKRRAFVASIWNQTGGVSKTTNTVNIGAALAILGKKVLLIDCDEQCDLSRISNVDPNVEHDWLSDFTDKSQMKDQRAAIAILQQSIRKRKIPTTGSPEEPYLISSPYILNVLPSSPQSLNRFRTRNDITDKVKIQIFKDLIKLLSHGFDYIFIDTSPQFDVFPNAILSSVDAVSIPIDYGHRSIHHGINIVKLLPTFRQQRQREDRIFFGPWNLGLVFSNCSSNPGSTVFSLVKNQINDHDPDIKRYETKIQHYSQTKVAEYRKIPVTSWLNSAISRQYFRLIKEMFLNSNFIKD